MQKCSSMPRCRTDEMEGFYSVVPSHRRIPGNERADCLVAAGHLEIPPSLLIAPSRLGTFIRDSVRTLHSDVYVAGGFPPTRVPRQWITRAASPLLHHLHADCASTKRTLHPIGRFVIYFCEPCRVIEDIWTRRRTETRRRTSLQTWIVWLRSPKNSPLIYTVAYYSTVPYMQLTKMNLRTLLLFPLELACLCIIFVCFNDLRLSAIPFWGGTAAS